MTVSNQYGHADEQGNVFLTTGSEPVKVGQYVAGTPQEGLEFFTRKFDELQAEIALSVARLKEGKATPDSVKPLLDKIAAAIENPTMLGDLAGLPSLKAELEELVDKRKAEVSAAKAAAKQAAVARRTAIVEAAEALVESKQWKSAGEKFKELLDEWKTLPRGERGVEQELWKRFSHARTAFDRARRAHFSTLDDTRAQAQGAKQAVLAKARELADSTDWKQTGDAFKELMAQWRTLPRAAKSTEDKLWAEFKELQDKFFQARAAAMAERDEALGGNLTVKLDLLARAEALLPIVDADKAKAAMRDIQEAWEKAGHVPRAEKEKVERRLKAVEDAIRKVADEHWHRTKPEVIDRANSLVTSFEANIAKLDDQIAAARAAGRTQEAERLAGQRESAVALLEAARASAAGLG